ncbi:AlpA family transcriptional regulator [Shewanella loihica]|uniref:Phage transcriptional regulator, AlpA n=1 Tax=Shewanella loihica (strain ATCC BAA-1088 / PV-4) TaxID=323850 RepID=A3QCD0_SHELP|nr:AlpA family transcriptional regulator [Shewanella loihica]ABO23128.1 phage transcriptional regulator, AlpA [Shewanella loihica PV-4]
MKLIKLKEVLEMTSLSKATLYRMIKLGAFPEQLSIGGRAVAWVEDEVLNWIEERIAARDAC